MDILGNVVYIGNKGTELFKFENNSIISIDGNFSCGIVGEELVVDTMNIVLDYEFVPPNEFRPKRTALTWYDGIMTADGHVFSGHYNGDLRTVPYATPVWVYNKELLVSKFFLDKITRTSRTRYELSLVSVVGLMDRKIHKGGVYDGTRTVASVVLEMLTNYYVDLPIGYIRQLYVVGGANASNEKYVYFSALTNNVNFTGNILRLEFAAETYGQGGGYMFGAKTLLGKNIAIYFDSSHDNRISIDMGNVNVYSSTFNLRDGKRHRIEIDDAKKSIYVDGVLHAHYTSTSIPDAPTTCDVGGWYDQSTNTHYGSYGIKYFNFSIESSSGELLMNLIPATTVLAPLVGGFYNSVNDRFISNVRTLYSLIPGGAVRDYNLPTFAINMTPEVAFTKVRGWLPYATVRENLYQLLFAYNFNLLRDASGGVIITSLSNPVATDIPDKRIFMDGDYVYDTPATHFEITEHTFVEPSEDTNLVELFDNVGKQSVEGRTVLFGTAPIDPTSIIATGSLYVDEAGCNYAVVSGTGTLKGKPYQHSREVIEVDAEESGTSEFGRKEYVEQRTITVPNATLVTAANSNTVAERLKNYYTHVNKINNSIILKNEKCGNYYSFSDPFKETAEAYLSKMSFSCSSFVKADCEMIVGYNRTQEVTGNYYTHRVILTKTTESTWTVPLEVRGTNRKIKIVVIGGGQGGSSGLAGENGTQGGDAWWDAITYKSCGGVGGNSGQAGIGGKVYMTEITNPAASYTYCCGVGGNGGAVNPSKTNVIVGSNGTDSYFGSYTSANGETIESGYVDVFSGMIYAGKGDEGMKGGDGAAYEKSRISAWNRGDVNALTAGLLVYDGKIYTAGFSNLNFGTGTYFEPMSMRVANVVMTPIYADTITGPIKIMEIPEVVTSEIVYYLPIPNIIAGGAGGGPAAGSNGNAGGDINPAGSREIVVGISGSGGMGATPVEPDQASIYGKGGTAGHGGGGGGGGGLALFEEANGVGGLGGNGGKGGKGGNGCIIIYY